MIFFIYLGENFSIKYHDMNDVVDFLVLKHNYEASLKVKFIIFMFHF